jgi:predicted transglutaminase-like cysteine proteinase
MSGRVTALKIVGCCIIALMFFGNTAKAMPAGSADVALLTIDIAPDVANLPGAAAAADEPFGLKTVALTSGDIRAKWTGVEADIRADTEVLARCRIVAEDCPAAAQRFLAIIADGRAHNGLARIGVVNRAINMAIIPTSDLVQWGVPDRWSSALETFTSGRGDCEDYAIAKYVALIQAGVSADDVKLVIVRDLTANEAHAVVAVRLDDRWIVLDNRWLRLLTDVAMPRVDPLFVLDHEGAREFLPEPVPNLATASASRGQESSAPSSVRN